MQMPAFDVDDDDDEDSTGHPRRHSDHPLPRRSLTAFAGHALAEPLPAHLGWSTGCWSSSGASSASSSLPSLTSAQQIVFSLVPMPSARRRDGPSQRRRYAPPHVDVVPRPPVLRHRRSRVDLQRSRVRSTPFTPTVVVANHASATFAFDAGRLYALSDASDVAQIDPLNVLVALLALLAATLIEPRWCVPYNES